MIRKTVNVEREKPQGGEGTVLVKNIISKEEFCGKGRMFAHVVLPPKTSFGFHRHVGETEPVYIIKGAGEFTDNDGSVTKVVPGDCCIISEGEAHAIANPFDEDLELIAMIYNTGDDEGHSETLNG